MKIQRIKVELEFDRDKLGEKWMNLDNLNLLLYSDQFTKKELLPVISYEDLK